ncbi:MAG: choice-of-anchor D domain-containing protein [Roseibacillus sp.]
MKSSGLSFLLSVSLAAETHNNFDAIDRLVSATTEDAYETTYTFDDAGNRTGRIVERFDHVVNAESGTGGTVNPSSFAGFSEDENVIFTATPDDGWIVEHWYLDGQSIMSGGNTLEVGAVLSGSDIKVTFRPEPVLGEISKAQALNDLSEVDHLQPYRHYDEFPRLSSDKMGKVVCVWYQRFYKPGISTSFRRLVFSTSDNSGATWAPQKILHPSMESGFESLGIPAIETDCKGNWMVVWHQAGSTGGADTDIYYSYLTDFNNPEWTEPTLLNTYGMTDGESDTDPDIIYAQAGSGVWVCAWEGRHVIDWQPGTDGDIVSARLLNLEESWSSPSVLNQSAYLVSEDDTDKDVSLTTNINGQIMAVWEGGYDDDTIHRTDSDRDGDDEIFWSVSSDGGLSWSADYEGSSSQRVPTSIRLGDGRDLSEPVVVGNGTKYMLVYVGEEDPDDDDLGEMDEEVYSAEFLNGNWTHKGVVNSNFRSDIENERAPQLACDGFGGFIATWSVDGIRGANDQSLLFSKYVSGLGWGAQQEVSVPTVFDDDQGGASIVSLGLEESYLIAWSEENEYIADSFVEFDDDIGYASIYSSLDYGRQADPNFLYGVASPTPVGSSRPFLDSTDSKAELFQLPDGMSYSNGRLYGVPTTPGDHTFYVSGTYRGSRYFHEYHFIADGELVVTNYGEDLAHSCVGDPGSYSAGQFGESVAIDGEYAVVGDYYGVPVGGRTGVAYILNVENGNIIHTLLPPVLSGILEFGSAVAIDGNFAFVSSEFDSVSGAHAGAVHIYSVINGDLIRTLTASDGTSFDYFGTSLSANTGKLLVGSKGDDDHGGSSGSAYLFDVETGQELHKFTNVSGSGSNHFGFEVALGKDYCAITEQYGDILGSNDGSVHIFRLDDYSLVDSFGSLTGAASQGYGRTLAIQSNTLAIGHDSESFGEIHLYDLPTQQFVKRLIAPEGYTGDQFGYDVAISDEFIAVGAIQEDFRAPSAGATYVFDRESYEMLYKLVPDDTSNTAFSGSSVALGGSKLVVGSPRQNVTTGRGRVCIYDLSSALIPEAGLFYGAVPIENEGALISPTSGTEFGLLNYHSGMVTRSYALRNLGNGDLSLSNLSSTHSDFTVTANQSSIQPGQATILTVTFDPSSLGSRQATISFNTNDPEIPTLSFLVRGEGAQPETDVYFTTTSIPDGSGSTQVANGTDFGSVDAITGVAMHSFIVRNSGNSPLSLTGLTSNNAEFNVSQLPAWLPAGSATTFWISFNPSSLGVKTGQITLSSNDSDEAAYTFAVSGTGIATPHAGSSIEMVGCVFQGVQPVLSWKTTNGATYKVEYTYDLQTWDTIPGMDNLIGDGEVMQLPSSTWAPDLTQNKCFIRVKSPR